jgi:ketosteroid isomerase-like protein
MGSRPAAQGELMSDDAVRIVDDYLQLCEDGQLEQASRYLAPDARLVFPGGRSFGSLAEMAAARRYRWARKRRDRYFVATAGEVTAVTSVGHLYGEDAAGIPFDSVRYADVFVLRAGLIVEQHVYNDLAEAIGIA